MTVQNGRAAFGTLKILPFSESHMRIYKSSPSLCFDYFFYVETFKETEFGFIRYGSIKYYSLVNDYIPLNCVL